MDVDVVVKGIVVEICYLFLLNTLHIDLIVNSVQYFECFTIH